MSAQKPCKYFINSGKCPKDRCKFAHVSDRETKKEYLNAKEDRRLNLSSLDIPKTCSAPEHSGTIPNSKHQELGSRHARARIFVAWLIENFLFVDDPEKPDQTIVIYDVAGGKGEVGFELLVRQRKSVKTNIKCFVVDPRKPEKYQTGVIPRWQRKILKVSRGAGRARYTLQCVPVPLMA